LIHTSSKGLLPPEGQLGVRVKEEIHLGIKVMIQIIMNLIQLILNRILNPSAAEEP
jgi:hypothetical protein